MPPRPQSWIPVPSGSPFPLSSLPYGVAGTAAGPHVVVAVGDHVLDLAVLAAAGLPTGGVGADVLAAPSLNPLLEAGAGTWAALRADLLELVTSTRRPAGVPEGALAPRAATGLRLPVAVGDFVDFFSSEHHAANMGRMLRPGADPLPPAWPTIPLGYHGRAGTLVPSGVAVRRPSGALGRAEAGPSRRLDVEVELGYVVGAGSAQGTPVALADAARHVFGVVLVNDWSARDIQAFESRPLGPFLGKSFATSMSSWVVPLAALEPFFVEGDHRVGAVAPHLAGGPVLQLDCAVELVLNGTVVSRTNPRHLAWTMEQLVAHVTANGASLRPGDLLATGTISGPDPSSFGSLMELSWGGTRPVVLDDGSERCWLEDGDTVTIRGRCGGADGPGLGVVTATVLPATS